MHYLLTLTDMLRGLGYHTLALPVLALCDVISRGIIKSRPLTAFIHLRLVFISLFALNCNVSCSVEILLIEVKTRIKHHFGLKIYKDMCDHYQSLLLLTEKIFLQDFPQMFLPYYMHNNVLSRLKYFCYIYNYKDFFLFILGTVSDLPVGAGKLSVLGNENSVYTMLCYLN